MGTDGKVEVKYTEHVPEYLRHLYQITSDGVADSYRDNQRLAYIKITNYDRGVFPALQEVDGVYLMFRHPEKKVML